MDAELVEKDGGRYVAATAGVRLLDSAKNAVDLVGLCGGYQANKLLLYSDNLPEGFFDLSTGEAGEILQKLRNYRVKLALVLLPGTRRTARFEEMAAEENRGREFHVFDGRDEAEQWLLGL